MLLSYWKYTLNVPYFIMLAFLFHVWHINILVLCLQMIDSIEYILTFFSNCFLKNLARNQRKNCDWSLLLHWWIDLKISRGSELFWSDFQISIQLERMLDLWNCRLQNHKWLAVIKQVFGHVIHMWAGKWILCTY